MSQFTEKIQVDVETAEEIRHHSQKQEKELKKILPRLAKRIDQKGASYVNTKALTDIVDPPKKEETTDEAPTPKPNSKAKGRRRSTVVIKPVAGVTAEFEELRTQDIEPDVNSAAHQALNAAAAAAAEDGETHASKRSGQKDNKTVRKVEGREISQDHEQYALTYAMMLGIRVTVGREQRTSVAQDRELCPDDFGEEFELDFLPKGSNGPPYPTPRHKLNQTFKFKDYMSNVFRAVRSLSGISDADYILSVAGDFNYIEFIANSKSRQFFFYSHDGKYMIKTQTKEECALLRQIMPQYVQHLSENPDSLLVRFYGMHRVKMKNMQSRIYFVIMSSVFDTDKNLVVKYDLKGSTVGRFTNPESCAQGAVQKDLNLMDSGRKFRFGEERIDIFYKTLTADVGLLKELNIMDYSLLVGVHQANKSEKNKRISGVVLAENKARQRESIRMSINQSSMAAAAAATAMAAAGTSPSIFQSHYGGIRSDPAVNEIYFMGIIDILQLYNRSKQLETMFKGISKDKTQLSCVDPTFYAKRMRDFVITYTDYEEIMEKRKKPAKPKNSKTRRDML